MSNGKGVQSSYRWVVHKDSRLNIYYKTYSNIPASAQTVGEYRYYEQAEAVCQLLNSGIKNE